MAIQFLVDDEHTALAKTFNFQRAMSLMVARLWLATWYQHQEASLGA